LKNLKKALLAVMAASVMLAHYGTPASCEDAVSPGAAEKASKPPLPDPGAVSEGGPDEDSWSVSPE